MTIKFFGTCERIPSGTVVDGLYRIERLVGAGGVAQVYAAVQEDIGRRVALKCVTAHFSSESLRRNFERRLYKEAAAAARLWHRNLVSANAFSANMTLTYKDRSETHDRPYLVMEYLEGHSLTQELAKGAMAPRRAMSLFLNCLDGLAVAHEAGIVHKDLKPDNLLLTNPDSHRESLVITDFGLVRDGESMTHGNACPFTPGYAAPEYLTQQIVSPALDVYQMGLVLVEMLSGRPAVPGDEPTRCIRAHLTGQLDIPERIRDGRLGDILQSALSLDYRTRIQNASVFHQVLSRVRPEEISAPSPRRSRPVRASV